MTLVGLVADYPLPELLFDLAARGRSGWLTLCSDTHDVEIVLLGGGVVAASSTNSRYRLGQRFLSQGHITNEQLDALLALQHQDRQKSTGELLVAAGYASKTAVQQALEEQLEELLASILTDDRAYFSFRRGNVRATNVRVDISLQHALFAAISHADEWLSQQLGSARIEIADIVTADMLESAVQGSWSVIEALLDGATTLQEIVDLAGIAREEARAGLTLLHGSGVVHVLAS
jgi:hypothetical protein